MLKTNHFLKILFLTFIVLPFLVEPSPALMVKISDQELTSTSNYIVVGTVQDQRCLWNRAQEPIVTLSTITVEKCIGPALEKKELVVKTLGGVLPEENVRLTMSDQPELKVGSKVVLFLIPDRYESEVFEINGYYQGKFTVVKNKVLERDLPLEDFIKQIEQIQGGGK